MGASVIVGSWASARKMPSRSSAAAKSGKASSRRAFNDQLASRRDRPTPDKPFAASIWRSVAIGTEASGLALPHRPRPPCLKVRAPSYLNKGLPPPHRLCPRAEWLSPFRVQSTAWLTHAAFFSPFTRCDIRLAELLQPEPRGFWPRALKRLIVSAESLAAQLCKNAFTWKAHASQKGPCAISTASPRAKTPSAR